MLAPRQLRTSLAPETASTGPSDRAREPPQAQLFWSPHEPSRTPGRGQAIADRRAAKSGGRQEFWRRPNRARRCSISAGMPKPWNASTLFARLNPNVAPLYQTRGLCLQRLGRLEEAQADFERSIALNPNEAETHKNLGTLHSRFGRMEQAFASFDRALALRPNFSAALNEKARALWSVQSLDEAFAAFHQSLAIEPGNADTIWNLALLQMLTGDFERGLSGREARWKASSLGLIDRGFSQALWLRDKPLEGKTILLHADEALGDSIQFARYVPFVAALGARVILEVKPAVQRLLAAVPGVAHCVDRSSTPSLAFDLHCPLGSLPLAFGTRLDTIPFAQGFLPAPPAERVEAWERPAWSPHALARRPGLVGGSRPQQRSQPVDIAARACAAAWIAMSSSSPCKKASGIRTGPSSANART